MFCLNPAQILANLRVETDYESAVLSSQVEEHLPPKQLKQQQQKHLIPRIRFRINPLPLGLGLGERTAMRKRDSLYSPAGGKLGIVSIQGGPAVSSMLFMRGLRKQIRV